MADERRELTNLKSLSPTLSLALSRKNIRQSIGNGLRMTALSTIGVMTTNLLNAYMATHNMEGRVFSVTLQPNPQRPPHLNPNKKVTGGSFQ